MNYALIFAGGVGSRMNSKARPKQFLEIHGKPVIVHTIEHFEHHDEIDGICVVCVSDWIDYMNDLVDKYRLKKVKWVVEGGKTALDSQLNGLNKIKENIGEDKAAVLIHDGVRPLINETLISDCIRSVEQYGNAITIAPANETIVQIDENGMIVSTIKRSDCRLARAPQAFWLSDIIKVHNQSISDGNHDYIDSASMMIAHGYKVHTVDGPTENIKVTNPSDFYICRALLDAKENTQIFGI